MVTKTRPTIREHTPTTTNGPVGGRVLAVTRVLLGFVFLWAFLDKAFGLGYATPGGKGWFDGGAPTRGFLSGLDHGPFADALRGIAGNPVADALFMLGLLGVGLALVLGIGLRIAAVSGTLMMALMWVAEWPLARHTDVGELTRSSNPLVDYHVVYAAALVVLAVLAAGDTWGLGRRWARLVGRNRWLR
ncbi:hypothetical protein V5P93_002803 [Actinokineospora auranticolor]|uniref:Thiosulfate dehydrogenase [quinone] large subunit n=1 Tax=Actinokineospora auranticolor TaxID=155976 RepID=A0A2S6H0D2_9PSEU|nr:hypothetical protein [Actinokineospora auranticolor]PPK70944.1 thiosulfate dehydrogenase [quinone] large subunit [Actinokineospora auranticolor]